MHCWPVTLRTCGPVPPLGDVPEVATSPPVHKRQVAVQYLHAASRSSDGRERARLRRRAADLILAR